MSYLDDDVRDNGLNQLPANVDTIHICSQEPANYLEATSTYSLGVKTSPVLGAPQNRTGGGREVEMSAFSDGSVNGTATATHFAWVDSVSSTLYAAQLLNASQVVTAGNSFSLDPHAVGVPGAA